MNEMTRRKLHCGDIGSPTVRRRLGAHGRDARPQGRILDRRVQHSFERLGEQNGCATSRGTIKKRQAVTKITGARIGEMAERLLKLEASNHENKHRQQGEQQGRYRQHALPTAAQCGSHSI